ncbi:MAG: N-acetylglucosamine-6-phosphate deacetylase [Chloroflexi bacterium]|nr:N-acetylglucosamine-6-phosphate deacetylase [Chloroflexota bacterium]
MEPGTVLRADRVITPDRELSPGWVVVEDGGISDLGEGDGPDAGESIDLKGLTLVPGFVDLHVHGGGGFSFDTGRADDVRGFRRWVPSTGVTSFLGTVIGLSIEDGRLSVEALASAEESEGGAELIGINLEGPFLSLERPGAIPPSWITPPDVGVFEALHDASDGSLRLMTVAPEVQGANEVIVAAQARGVTISVGHSAASYDVALRTFGGGARHVTHAFNGMSPFHHRDPGIVGAALDSAGVTIEVIADGVHLHPATVSMLVQAFGTERVALITDAVPMAGRREGSLRLGDQVATLKDGRVTLPDGTIAGSASTMDSVVRNVVRWGVCDLAGVVRMASTVPAAAVAAGNRKGRIEQGYDADLVALDSDLRVVATWVGGELAFEVKKRYKKPLTRARGRRFL